EVHGVLGRPRRGGCGHSGLPLSRLRTPWPSRPSRPARAEAGTRRLAGPRRLTQDQQAEQPSAAPQQRPSSARPRRVFSRGAPFDWTARPGVEALLAAAAAAAAAAGAGAGAAGAGARRLLQHRRPCAAAGSRCRLGPGPALSSRATSCLFAASPASPWPLQRCSRCGLCARCPASALLSASLPAQRRRPRVPRSARCRRADRPAPRPAAASPDLPDGKAAPDLGAGAARPRQPARQPTSQPAGRPRAAPRTPPSPSRWILACSPPHRPRQRHRQALVRLTLCCLPACLCLCHPRAARYQMAGIRHLPRLITKHRHPAVCQAHARRTPDAWPRARAPPSPSASAASAIAASGRVAAPRRLPASSREQRPTGLRSGLPDASSEQSRATFASTEMPASGELGLKPVAAMHVVTAVGPIEP
ncbi:hypothetical protein BS50DRAFT_665468, partial [Corynespora cassiicola Philippines]